MKLRFALRESEYGGGVGTKGSFADSFGRSSLEYEGKNCSSAEIVRLEGEILHG